MKLPLLFIVQYKKSTSNLHIAFFRDINVHIGSFRLFHPLMDVSGTLVLKMAC